MSTPFDDLRAEVELLLRARYPILALSTFEEERALRLLREAAAPLGREVLAWSCTEGFRGDGARPPGDASTPRQALEWVARSDGRSVFALLDFHPFFGEPAVARQLRDLARDLVRSYKTLVLVSPVLDLPREVEKDVTVLDLPLPSPEELDGILTRLLQSLQRTGRVRVDADPALRERVVRATCGLTAAEAENVYKKAIVHNSNFGEGDLPLIVAEKKQLIRRGDLLEYVELGDDLGALGGLDALKGWLRSRAVAFSEDARAYGLPQPRGLLLLGVQGCGKSLTAKAIAAQWNMPLLRLDVGAVFGSYVGQSEGNLRRAVRIAESMAPAVLWLDEIEKGFAGAAGAASADSGTTARVFASFLTWLQEKRQPVFVVATANDVRALPAELLRKGRFDEIFFVDLPAEEERREILGIHLRRRRRDPATFDLPLLASRSEGFSGAEIEQAVVDALYRAFPEGRREPTTADVLAALAETVPLSRTMAEPIAALRTWAAHRARDASGRRPPSPAPAG
ncbi:AAA family ATPase [Myxococcota bacterium]|nr:AAA family ATPase [Myxococcota bacterium]